MSQKNNIGDLYKQLEEITEWFESAESKDVEAAIEKYEKAQEVIKELNSQLKTLKNKITKIDANFE